MSVCSLATETLLLCNTCTIYEHWGRIGVNTEDVMSRISQEMMDSPVDGVNLAVGEAGQARLGDQLPAGQATLLVFLRHLG